MVEILRGRIVEVPWVVGSCRPMGEIKVDFISTLTSSGGMVVIGSVSTSIVDRILKFVISEVRVWRML
jgi:hypothetical protein